MKKFLLPALAALLAFPAMARDFTYTYEGQSLVYTVINETARTCMVKCGAPVTPAPDEGKGEPTGIYLRGSMNEWGATEEWEFRTTDNADEYVIKSCTIASGTEFKVADANWASIILGANNYSMFLVGDPYTLYWGWGDAANIVLNTDFTGDVRLSRKGTEYTLLFEPASWNIIKGELVIPAIASDGENEYTVTQIVDEAFKEYMSMTSVTMPNTITSIGDMAFYLCKSLAKVSLSNTLEEIGHVAFTYCNSLTEINLPGALKSIRIDSFDDCSNLAAINVDASNQVFSSIDGMLIDKQTGELIKCPEGKKGDLTIPSSITGIRSLAIFHCNELVSITVPSSVKEIPAAFAQSCKKLQTVSLPASIEKIGGFPFIECPALYEIKVEEGCKDYYSLDGILFSNMDNNLTLVRFPQNKALMSPLAGKYDIPEGVKTIGEHAFYKSIGLNYINIPATVTAIETEAFNQCSSLCSVIIPPSVETIGKEAFFLIEQLESLTIPASVKSIGDNAFGSCYRLENVYYNTATPVSYSQSVASYLFRETNLFIRPEGVEAAKATAPWSDFMNIIPYDFDNINNKDYYLVGDFNDWTNSMAEYKFTPAGDGKFEFDYDGTLIEFKITDGTWDAAGVYGGDKYQFTVTPGGSKILIQPGTNLNFGDFTGVKNAHIVFNPSERTLVVTGEEVKISYIYEIWGNFSTGGDEWAAIEMRSDNNDGLWIAENLVAENECQFLLRQMRADGKILFWGHSTDGALITEPGTYVVGWQDYNFSIAPGTWDLMYDERTGMLTVSAASGSVDGIEADDNVAPVYYNLQGVRVDNPASGLYIVVRGSKTTKEYIK